MKKIINLTESDLNRIIKRVLNEGNEESNRYMFFSNLQQIRRQCDMLLEMDQSMIEGILENGHDWAQDLLEKDAAQGIQFLAKSYQVDLSRLAQP